MHQNKRECCVSSADTLNVLDADDLDLCTIIWATIAHVVANLDVNLQRVDEILVSGVQRPAFSCSFLAIVLSLSVLIINARNLQRLV